jgi:redox-sensitive bicupin YhaK (pirin superfamily)
MNMPDAVIPGEVQTALRTLEGDGAEVLRLFPVLRGRMNLDPFMLFDHFFLEPGTGFPTHPHRGFEAITYLFEGGMQHRDNLGNDSTVTAGGVQCFTAGRGIEHSEMPSGKTRGIQLWINLSQANKKIAPAYQAVLAEEVPVNVFNGGQVRIIVGHGSSLKLHTPVRYEDITLEAGGDMTIELSADWQGFIYVVDGGIRIGYQGVEQGQAICLGGGTNHIQTKSGARIMLCAGRPHGEPVHQYGPYVD